MNSEVLPLFKKHRDTLIQQTKTKPQETLEFKLNKQMQTFSLNPTINLYEEKTWLLAVTSFGGTNSVCNVNDANNSFSIGSPNYCRIPNFLPDGNLDRLKERLQLRSQNDIKLHVQEVEKKGS